MGGSTSKDRILTIRIVHSYDDWSCSFDLNWALRFPVWLSLPFIFANPSVRSYANWLQYICKFGPIRSRASPLNASQLQVDFRLEFDKHATVPPTSSFPTQIPLRPKPRKMHRSAPRMLSLTSISPVHFLTICDWDASAIYRLRFSEFLLSWCVDVLIDVSVMMHIQGIFGTGQSHPPLYIRTPNYRGGLMSNSSCLDWPIWVPL
jgi:hypothetical protein